LRPERPLAARLRGQVREAGDIFLPTGEVMAQHEASTPSSGDKILREIVQREQKLQEELTRARQEAARSLEEAQREADAIRARAREQAQQEAAEASRAAAAEAQTITEKALAGARADAEAVRKRAEERMGEAVALVVREVLGETT
jgi:vacuolar-type H+-ATPase subunit H